VNEPQPVKPAATRRAYHAPRRAEAAARTREAILQGAKQRFEELGWAGTTIPGVAAVARVSPKTVEALFATKAGLLAQTAQYAIRGDTSGVPIVRREAALAMEQAPDAGTMLERHAAMCTEINERAARIALVVESGAASDARVAELWERMRRNHADGVRWAAARLMEKPGRRHDLTPAEAEEVIVVAMSFGTYRELAQARGLSREAIAAWICRYYRRMLLDPA
jgi:AcrR family transcriptional regulator